MVFLLSAMIAAPSQAAVHLAYPSLRPLGMGRAFIGVANDANAPLYNPAGLALIHSTSIRVVDLSLGIANEGDTDGLYNALTAGMGDNGGGTPSDGLEMLSGLGNGSIHLDFGGTVMGLTFPGMALGSYTTVRGLFESFESGEFDILPNLRAGLDSSSELVLSYAQEFKLENDKDRKFKLYGGLNAKQVKRDYFIIDTTVINKGGSDLITGLQDAVTNQDFEGFLQALNDAATATENVTVDPVSDSGSGVGLDLGMLAVIDNKHSIGLSIMDAMTTISWQQAARSEKVDPTLGIGFSTKLANRFLFAADMVRSRYYDTDPFSWKLHMGMEATLAFLTVRAGISENATTFGASLKLWILQMDFASASGGGTNYVYGRMALGF